MEQDSKFVFLSSACKDPRLNASDIASLSYMLENCDENFTFSGAANVPPSALNNLTAYGYIERLDELPDGSLNPVVEFALMLPDEERTPIRIGELGNYSRALIVTREDNRPEWGNWGDAYRYYWEIETPHTGTARESIPQYLYDALIRFEMERGEDN